MVKGVRAMGLLNSNVYISMSVKPVPDTVE